jgi:metallo-beta-lactamase family protein
MNLTFLGAARTVTGSKYLITTNKTRTLVDCGLFQGGKELRSRNWEPLPVDAEEIDNVVLTHAHLDHSGYIPALWKRGFKGNVISTHGTRDLCAILLPDSGKIQEEDAEYANRKGFSKHKPALALYTEDDAVQSLDLFKPISFSKTQNITDDMLLELTINGHILGSSFATLMDKDTSIVFSGDMGRNNDLLMFAPRWIRRADYLVIESTYGNRTHDKSDVLDDLEAVINKTLRRKGVVLIPAFAVGRTQHVLYAIHLLKKAGRIPNEVPVFLNSPMAINATELFVRYAGEHKLDAAQCAAMADTATYVQTVEDSKELDEREGPMIIISASGMATGGRVLHHLRKLAPDANNTILFTGFQAEGTRGRSIVQGAESVKIHGIEVPIHAEVASLDNLSAHADRDELLTWMSHLTSAPKKVFVTHGEESASEALKAAIEEKFGWSVEVPSYGDVVELA